MNRIIPLEVVEAGPKALSHEERVSRQEVLKTYTRTLVAAEIGISRLRRELKLPEMPSWLDLMRKIEWNGSEVHFICPSCRRDRQHGHDKGCPLDAILTLTSEAQP